MNNMTFTDRIIDQIEAKDSSIVVGLDPNLEYFPDCLHKIDTPGNSAQAIEQFNKIIIDAVKDHAVAVKPQLAYYEQLGTYGLKALSNTIEYAKQNNLIVINDAKRNDIGSTSEAYAKAFLDDKSDIAGDALTVNPYLGSDGINPFVDTIRESDKGIFVLVKTSNPSSSEIQNLVLDTGEFLYEKVAKDLCLLMKGTFGPHGYSSIGAVVGATYPKEAERLRKFMPKAFFLVPGVGAQGATISELAPYFDPNGYGALINSSRGIMYSFRSKLNQWKSINETQIYEFAKEEAIALKSMVNEVRK